MPRPSRCLFSLLALVATLAGAQEVAVLRDLDAAGRVTLSKAELDQLIPDAKMSRMTGKGNTQLWQNDAGGSFVISSDNRADQGKQSTATGKWHVSDDGRYCVLIEWKKNPTEEWCRYILKSGNEYYATRSDKTATERVYKLGIAK